MEADELRKQEAGDHLETLTLDLFDIYWFRGLVLYNHRPPPRPPLPPPPPATDIAEDGESRTLLPSAASLIGRRSNHRRSLSDDLTPTPMNQGGLTKLQTILSGKEATVAGDEIQKPGDPVEGQEQRWRNRRDRRRRRRSECSKSMSELEFEELKGFMDLGFTFSDTETDPRLMEIVPGLQRLRATATDEGSSASSADDMAAPRPYLSEAWDEEAEEEENQLRWFRIPIESAGDRVDLKDQLRFWAHAVASTVR